MTSIAIRITKHAAHYMGGIGGHDLEISTFAAPVRVRPEGLHPDAEYHSGYVADGVQHWVYTRKLPLSPGRCAYCPRVP